MRIWRQEPGEAYEVSMQLVKKTEEMYACSIIQDEDGDPVLDVELALKSLQYKTFINSICELDKITLSALSDTKRTAFFLNVYQCMYVHNFFKMISEGHTAGQTGYFRQVRDYLLSSKQPFCYSIAGMTYSLGQIKHGMLRGNRCKPGHLMRSLSTNDPRIQ